MKFNKVYILLSVSFLSGTILLASDKIFERKENNSYVFGYSSSQPVENSTTNYFIKEIAKYNLSGLYNTSYTFHYEANNGIQLTSPNTFCVSTDIIGKKCSGDIMYKGFDISDILMPEKLDIKLIVISNGNYITSKDFFGIAFDDSNHCHIDFIFESLDEDKIYTLKLDNIKFYSDSKDQEKFNFRINQIDDYYASIAIIDHALEEFKQISIERNSILEFYLNLRELELTFNEVSDELFLTELGIKSNDIGDYYKKLGEMKNQLVRYTEYFDILTQSIDFFRFNKTIKQFSKLYVEKATRYLILSQEVTHSHSRYFYSLGGIDYNNAMVNRYGRDIKKVLNKSTFCNSGGKILQKLQNEVFNVYMDKASDMIENQQFHLAIGLLQNAEKYYKISNGQTLPVALNILISKANYGIFDFYLQLIDRAIEVGNYDLAENYLSKAKEYQKVNSISIISEDYTLEISEQLAVLYIAKGNQLNEDGEYKNASYCFEQALQLCHKIGRFNYDYEIKHGLMSARNEWYKNLINQIIDELEVSNFETAEKLLEEANQLVAGYYYEIIYSPEHVFLRSSINHHFYEELIKTGKILLEAGDYRLAYEKFLTAFDLEAKSNFELSPDLPELFYRAATPVLVDLCSLGEVKVRKSQLNEAREIYNNCFQLQEDYGLIYEANVQESLTLLNNSIFNRHCEMVNQEFEEIIVAFNNSVDQGDFISAIEILNTTDNLTSKNYYCELDKGLVSEFKSKYGPAAEYQQLAKVAQDALVNKNHEKFIEAHERMKFLSSNYEVIRKYIEPLPLHYLFSVKKNLALLESSIEYFKSQEEFETVLDLLVVLEANNYSDKDTKAIQQTLGKNMALADKECIYTADPLVIVNEYTEGKTYLKHFKKAYIKNW